MNTQAEYARFAEAVSLALFSGDEGNSERLKKALVKECARRAGRRATHRMSRATIEEGIKKEASRFTGGKAPVRFAGRGGAQQVGRRTLPLTG